MKNNSDFYRLTSILVLLVLGGCSRQYMVSVVTQSAATSAPTTSISTATAFPPPSNTATPVNNMESTDEPDCLALGGQVKADRLPSKQMGGEMEFHIYLPPCYEQNVKQHYPVLYLFHGQSSTDEQWIKLGVPQTADKLISEGLLPFIVVMPQDKYNYRQPAADPFDEAVTGELIPYIDTYYRTIPERTFRAVGGLSRGAGWALHLALTHPELFGTFGGHSLAILDEDGAHLTRLLDAVPPSDMPRIFMDIGKSDGLRASTEKFESLLTERGIPHEWYVNPGFHNEAYWTKHVEEYLRWYDAGWAGK
jgi:enterochelin esterase-like enzyme